MSLMFMVQYPLDIHKYDAVQTALQHVNYQRYGCADDTALHFQ